MSSHHFVKEGQEPALIVANGEACSFALLNDLLQWCPFVVALDGAYNRLTELEIKPDVVIGDFDSIKHLPNVPDIDFIKIEDQETTDLEKGINYLLKKGFTDINIAWATGKRLDHTMNNIAVLAKYPESNLVVYDDYSKAFILPKLFEKHYQAGDKLSLLPIGIVNAIKTKGLKYGLRNESLDLSSKSGSSNEVLNSGIVSITHEEGLLILIESTDEN